MAVEDIMPQFKPEYPKQMFHSKVGERLRTRFLGGIETRVNEFEQNADVYVYMGNHTSMLDYVAANHGILEQNLPYPVSVAGSNLNNVLYKKAIIDFNKWGVIWHDRKATPAHMKTYLTAIKSSLENNQSILIYPEAGRNRDPENGLRPFANNAIKSFSNAAKKLKGKTIAIAPFAIHYNDYPEKDRWDTIDGRRGKFLGEASYLFHDTLGLAKWYLAPHKENTKIGFGKPIPFSECGSVEEASEKTRYAITDLLTRLQE